jgi:catechol 2,3-dioxygenase-like lactoylglutathione lyase family enzyme
MRRETLMPMNLLLKCNDVDETKAFYADILEFEVTDSAEGTCTVQKEGGTIVFSGVDLWGGSPQLTGTIYFFLSEVDKYYEAVKGKVFIRWPPEDTAYGTREFAVEDCNGYTLAFARSDDAVNSDA